MRKKKKKKIIATFSVVDLGVAGIWVPDYVGGGDVCIECEKRSNWLFLWRSTKCLVSVLLQNF